MSLVRFDPFRDLDRSVSDLFGHRRAAIPMDAYRRGDDVYLHFDLPGVTRDGVELTVEHHTLTVVANRYWEAEEGDTVIAQERPQGAFRRQVLLADNLDTDRLEATFANGVLTIRIPTVAATKARQVPIRVVET